MKFEPFEDRILVKEIEEKESVIIKPETAKKETPNMGEIVAIGKGLTGVDGKRIPMKLKLGTKILFGLLSGTPVTIEDEEFIIMREDNIFGTFP